MLNPAERSRLERRAATEELRTGNQVVVVIFPSLAGESLEDVSIRLAERWKVGRAGRDNGVIVLVFLQDHKARIEVGYGLEARLTDGLASSIIRNEIAPLFRRGRYAEGLDAGLTAIFTAIASDSPARPPMAARPVPLAPIAFLLLFFVLFAMLAAASRRQPGVHGRRGYTAGPGGWYFGGGGFGGGGGGGGFGGGGGSFGGGGASGSW